MKKIAFVTCVELGVSCMHSILNNGFDIDVTFTLKDEKAENKSGRVNLNHICKKNGIDLIKVENINLPIVCKELVKRSIDILFIIGWSQIAKKELIKIPKLGVYGIHPTLLPEGRGRAPIPWAIIKGLKVTGATLFKINAGVDTGEIILQKKIMLNKSITSTQLYQKMKDLHISLIKTFLIKLQKNKITLLPQNEKLATYWPKRTPEMGGINLKGSVYDADKLCRALMKPYPGAFFIKNNKKIIIDDFEIFRGVLDKNTEKMSLSFYDGHLIVNKFREETLLK
tara:strand:+ start:281 stop:1129 length:849 start_codon:yes stop_codon:yes gene_type:complete